MKLCSLHPVAWHARYLPQVLPPPNSHQHSNKPKQSQSRATWEDQSDSRSLVGQPLLLHFQNLIANFSCSACSFRPDWANLGVTQGKTRPSINYTKDWAGQLFLFPGLAWKRESPMDVITRRQSTTILVTSAKAVFCKIYYAPVL